MADEPASTDTADERQRPPGDTIGRFCQAQVWSPGRARRVTATAATMQT